MLTLPDILRDAYVFPIVEGTKDPATKHGWKDASNDPAQIAEWLRVNPNFNWGVACGPSGLFIFDIDPAGLQWWHDLLDRDPVIKAAVDRAFQVRTPKGGLHVYFKGEGPSTASRIADGIDTRGGIKRDGKFVSGGYVVLPGSKTVAGPGRVNGEYTAIGGTLEPMPDFVSALVPERRKTDTLGLEKNPNADQPRNIAWAIDLLKGYVETGRVSVEGKGGNNTAFQVCCSVLDKAISPAVAFDLLTEHWNSHCVPPWDEWELETLVRNAATHGEDTGGGVKGFQANEDAFAAFAGQEFEAPKTAQDASRPRLQWIHDYADNVRDPTWLVPGFVPAQGTGMLYGPSGSYKSFLALDMALCLAYGVPGQWGAPPVKNDVLFIAGEGPIGTARKRWPAWMEANHIEFRNDHRFILKDRVPVLSDHDGWEHVKEDLALLDAKPALIVIDTLSRLLTGLDENSSKDATMVVDFCESLARYYEAFVLVVHHTGKDVGRGARGSSVFQANFDSVLSTKTKNQGTELRVRKHKDADVTDELFGFEVQEAGPSIYLRRTGKALTDTREDKGESKAASRYAWATMAEVVAVLHTLGGSTSDAVLFQHIASAHGIERDLVRKQLNKADELKWLRPEKGKWEIPTQEYDL